MKYAKKNKNQSNGRNKNTLNTLTLRGCLCTLSPSALPSPLAV